MSINPLDERSDASHEQKHAAMKLAMKPVDNDHDGIWQSILAEVPEYTREPGTGRQSKTHMPIRLGAKVYTLHESHSGCIDCVAEGTNHGPNSAGYPKGLCFALPGCDEGHFKEFTPADFAILVARGDNIKGDPHE